MGMIYHDVFKIFFVFARIDILTLSVENSSRGLKVSERFTRNYIIHL